MKNKLNNELSEYIKLCRFKKKVSQLDIANKLNISRQAYTNWENNPIKLDLDKLIDIGSAIGEDILIFFNNYIAKCNKNKEQED